MRFGRTIDKCRALVGGNIGEYHFDRPLDNMLFGSSGAQDRISKPKLRRAQRSGNGPNGLMPHGEQQSPDEVQSWCDEVEKATMMDNPEKRLLHRGMRKARA